MDGIRQGNTILMYFVMGGDTLGLIIFGVFGMALCQYAFPLHRHRRCGYCDGIAVFGAIYDYHLFADALWQTAFYRRNHFSYPCFSRYYLLRWAIMVFLLKASRSDVLFWGLLSRRGRSRI